MQSSNLTMQKNYEKTKMSLKNSKITSESY
jgi:hypothetical protein